jgi:arylformamidase
MDKVDQLASLIRSMKAVDLAPRIERGIPRWPTHPHLVVDPTMNHEHDGYYCQSLAMAEHTGCHVDTPSHIHSNMMDATIDSFPIKHLLSPAVVYDFSALNLKEGDLLDANHIENFERESAIKVGPDEIALVNFGWIKKHWRTDRQAQWYATNSPGMTEAAVRLFADRGIRAVGADTIACEISLVDGQMGDYPGHRRYWLPRGILILECVANLEQVQQRCFFAALPLPIDRGSGSPLRPVALF